MHRPLANLTLAALALLVAPSAGQNAASRLPSELWKNIERLQLFNACRPMLLFIGGLDDDAAAIGLTESTVQAAAESRLRAARLYAGDILDMSKKKTVIALLFVKVAVGRRAFNISVDYNKVVADEFGGSGLAVTWGTESFGAHDGDAGFIVSSLSQRLDEFLAAYLRVNEAACEAR